MNQDQRFRIISEGQRNGVSETCRKHGISRTIYYRWLSRYKKNGFAGLANHKNNAAPHNKTSLEMANLVLELIQTYPLFGPRELMYRIQEMGHQLSESTIYQLMRKHQLSTRKERLKFISKRKPILQSQNEDALSSLPSNTWLIWITSYGKFSHRGPVYEYSIYDFDTHIACSRLYQSLSVTCFEELLTAVALPVAQSMNLNPDCFCFMQDAESMASRKQQLVDGIEEVLLKYNLEGQMRSLTSSKLFPSAYEKRKNYTQRILTHLMDSLTGTVSFDAIKTQLQQLVRSYNLQLKQNYSNGSYTPLEYHALMKKIDLVLPLWAYFDRPYEEVKP